MSTPNLPPTVLPPRRVPGWLYAFLYAVTLGSYLALVLTNHSGDTASLLLIAAPILGSVFVADRVSAIAKKEGENTRHALTNGSLTQGILNALDHPDVITKVVNIVKGASS